MHKDLEKFYDYLYGITYKTYDEYIKTNVEYLFDEEFLPYNKNRLNILLFYSMIKKNKEKFLGYGFNYFSKKYGKNNLNTTPILFNEKYIIMFFTNKNKLNNKVIQEYIEISKNDSREMIIITFDLLNENILFKEKTNVNGLWKAEEIVYEK